MEYIKYGIKNGQLKYEVETHKTHNDGLKKEWYERWAIKK